MNKERFLTLEIRIYKRYLKNKKKTFIFKREFIDIWMIYWSKIKCVKKWERERARERARGRKEKPKCPWWKYNKVAIKRGD